MKQTPEAFNKKANIFLDQYIKFKKICYPRLTISQEEIIELFKIFLQNYEYMEINDSKN